MRLGWVIGTDRVCGGEGSSDMLLRGWLLVLRAAPAKRHPPSASDRVQCFLFVSWNQRPCEPVAERGVQQFQIHDGRCFQGVHPKVPCALCHRGPPRYIVPASCRDLSRKGLVSRRLSRFPFPVRPRSWLGALRGNRSHANVAFEAERSSSPSVHSPQPRRVMCPGQLWPVALAYLRQSSSSSRQLIMNLLPYSLMLSFFLYHHYQFWHVAGRKTKRTNKKNKHKEQTTDSSHIVYFASRFPSRPVAVRQLTGPHFSKQL